MRRNIVRKDVGKNRNMQAAWRKLMISGYGGIRNYLEMRIANLPERKRAITRRVGLDV